MRRNGVWGLTVALLLGGSLNAARADELLDDTDLAKPKPARYRHTNGVLEQLFREDSKPLDKKPAADSDAKSAKKSDKKGAKPAAKAIANKPASERSKEEATWLRRVDACAALKRIAEETNDLELLDQAEKMDERAWAIYQERTAKLHDADVGSEADEKSLLESANKKPGKKDARLRASLEGKP